MPNHNYNYIYDKLVEDENDIFGILAYSIYKRQKIEFLTKFKADNGRDPTQVEIAPFQKISNSDTQLEFYNTQALYLANAFLEEALSEDLDSREKDFSNRVHAELSKIKNGFFSGVAQSLIGSILFVLFVGVVVFFSWSLNQGFSKAVESIFNVEITPIVSDIAPSVIKEAPVLAVVSQPTIAQLQSKINSMGFTGNSNLPLVEDGKWGSNTEHALNMLFKTCIEFDATAPPKIKETNLLTLYDYIVKAETSKCVAE